MEKITENSTYDEDDSAVVVPPPDVVAYNELRSCADLFRMYEEGILDIQPDFQRDVVWSSAAMTRFIDSLMKQLPIPSMCFSLDYKTQRWQVIDGLQRLSSIINFLDKNSRWTLSKLKDIDQAISGVSVREFRVPDTPLSLLQRRVENMSIPITVLRCDYSKPEHSAYLFTIFHRLNTGGVKLNNQEIRNCIFSGRFNDLLKQLNKNADWISVTKQKAGSRTRYRWIEQILRFFAFLDAADEYTGSLAKFLNDYMSEHRNIADQTFALKRSIFDRTAKVLQSIRSEIPGGQWNRTILETLMYGIGSNIDLAESMNTDQLIQRVTRLRKCVSLSPAALSFDLSSKEKVTARLSDAKVIFGGG